VANTRSAEKRNRQSQKRRARNVQARTVVKGAVKKAREALEKGDMGQAKVALQAATKTLGKAGSKGIIHPNNVSRRISRLNLALAKASQGTPPAAQ
jgi:small subunit ribosomal protein S20